MILKDGCDLESWQTNLDNLYEIAHNASLWYMSLFQNLDLNFVLLFPVFLVASAVYLKSIHLYILILCDVANAGNIKQMVERVLFILYTFSTWNYNSSLS